MGRPRWILALTLAVAVTACERDTFDWEQRENFKFSRCSPVASRSSRNVTQNVKPFGVAGKGRVRRRYLEHW